MLYLLISLLSLMSEVKAQAPSVREGIEIRMHIPNTERLVNESHHRAIIRIENRSDSSLLINTRKDVSRNLAQFRSQMKADVGSQNSLNLPLWSEIKEVASLTVMPGEAVEMIGNSAMGLSPPIEGESRLVFQTGENEVVYSNWITTETAPAIDHSKWPLVATLQVTPGETGIEQYLVGETPSGDWLFRRPVWNQKILKRVCPIPDRANLRLSSDTGKRQVEISFGVEDADKIYHNGALGVYRRTPWPEGNIGSDFINKPMPVDSPSPLEFPMGLFKASTNPPESDSQKNERGGFSGSHDTKSKSENRKRGADDKS